MDAWSSNRSREILNGRTPLERQGALVFPAEAVPQVSRARRKGGKTRAGSRRGGLR